jgi:hypothetical protein
MHICNTRQLNFFCGDSKDFFISIALSSDIVSFCVHSSCFVSFPFHTNIRIQL